MGAAGAALCEMLEHIYRSAGPVLVGDARVQVGPGDDMAVLALGPRQVLVTVDQLIDQVHVDLAGTSLQRVARKAITRNLSDVAAMAARPTAAVVAAALPRDFGQDRATALFDAMRDRAYWLHLQEYVNATPSIMERDTETVTFRIPVEQKLSLIAIDRFRQLSHAAVARFRNHLGGT